MKFVTRALVSLAIVSNLVFCAINCSQAQEKPLVRQCGTMQLLKEAFEKNPLLKGKFEKQTREFQRSVINRKAMAQTLRIEQTVIYVPIVFHIVLPDPAVITDAQVQAQLDVLNKDFGGTNSDSVNIPAAFKPLFGKSQIQFKLAQRTPDDEPANGIVRTVARQSVFSTSDKNLKYTTLGGDDAWDRNRFFNVWITNLSLGFVLGYATLPGTSVPAEDGVVIHYATLPADSLTATNRGRTLTHETGHYFYLYHIWGDERANENGCSGTDFVDDTPNQGSLTSGCPGGIITDACSPAVPGILYEDYMDYTDDACMCLFTNGQVARMETALNDYRAGFYTSNGADPVHLFSWDAGARKINTPFLRTCSPTFSPVITLRNRGTQVLSSVDLYASIDNGPAILTHWTGALSSLGETTVTLNPLSTTEGNHVIKVAVSLPNGNIDQNTANDTITGTFEYHQAATTPFTEGFENNTFPPAGWDIINPDNGTTWELITGVAKTGHASAVLHNFDYQLINQKDYLRLPLVNITSGDSAFLSFQVAAAVRLDPANVHNLWDTLQVLVSTDCGATYTSLYKKWGGSLITHSTALTSSFVPAASEWRKDLVNLSPYINAGPILLGFMNTTEMQNNIYLDDITIYTTNNTNLTTKGFMVTPNPATGIIAVQFYPDPVTLKSIVIYNSAGQKVAEQAATGAGASYYSFNLTRFASGVYIVQAIFSDKKLTQKVVKR